MGLPLRKKKDNFTYAQYKDWNDDERWEIIDGEAFAMTPAPGTAHQGISAALIGLIIHQ